jgi:hypothetical protein
MPTPVRYSPDVERPIADEEKVHRELIDTMRSITETTSKDYGHAVRSVHAKSHALLEGEMEVLPDLPPELAQGLFADAGRHKVVMRLSTNPGDLLDDSVSSPRGLALKILDVAGERLPDSQGETAQNFILVNAPAFGAPDAAAFVGNLKMLAATTDRAEWAKKLLSGALRAVESVVEATGAKSALVSTLGGQPMTHPLGDSYYTQTPFRYGDFIAKLALVPVSPNLTDLKDDPVSVADRPDALREVVRETVIEQGGTWELRVQLCTDLDAMPVEDASVAWDEAESPYRTVARITAAPQLAWSPDRAKLVDDQMYFSPWHGLAAHQPLGSVNRTRRHAYEMSAEYRANFNGCPMHEPERLDALPS